MKNYKKPLFEGLATALITPFTENGIDFDGLQKCLEVQKNGGANALVLLGTTGEASTVSEPEREACIRLAVKTLGGKIPLIVGCGSNDTKKAVFHTQMAKDLGADGALVVTPYYNKATKEGLLAHYKAVGDVGLPVIVYHVPSRTGLTVPLSLYKELSEIKNIVGVKEASGNLSYFAKAVRSVENGLPFYTGNDELFYDSLCLGGRGCISVVSNVFLQKCATLYQKFQQNDTQGALKIQNDLSPAIDELFREVNPIPVKTAMSLLGFCKPIFRLPLTKSTREKEIKRILKS